MRTLGQYLAVVTSLGATAWTSARMGYRHGMQASAMAAPVHAIVDEEHWQYQTYDCGRKTDSFADSRRISEVINSYAAKGFEPCSAPTGIFPEGLETDRLMWFRRQANPFSPSITPIAENRSKDNGQRTTDN